MVQLDNNIEMARGFFPSLTKEWRDKHNIVQKHDNYHETLGVIKDLQNEGFVLRAGDQHMRNGKPTFTQFILDSPFSLGIKGVSPRVYLRNSIDGSSPLSFNSGVYRKVCSNGIFAISKKGIATIQHTQEYDPMVYLERLEREFSDIEASFEKIQDVHLHQDDILHQANKIIKFRADTKDDVDAMQLNQCHRPEDKGDNLWLTFNRFQENLTKDFLLKNKKGDFLPGVRNTNSNVEINQRLYAQMVGEYV